MPAVSTHGGRNSRVHASNAHASMVTVGIGDVPGSRSTAPATNGLAMLSPLPAKMVTGTAYLNCPGKSHIRTFCEALPELSTSLPNDIDFLKRLAVR